MRNYDAMPQFSPGSGMRSPGFSSGATPTTSTALPAALANLLPQGGGGQGGGSGINMQALQMPPTGTVASNPNYPVLDFRMQPTYADGGPVPPDMGMMQQGMMQPGQMPMNPQGGMMPQGGAAMGAQDMQGEIQRIAQSNPQVIQQIQQTIMQAIQSGQLTMEQLNTAVQLATAAAQNPELYPRLRQLAIQRGLASEDELPQQYDQGIVFALILAGAAVQQQMGGGQQQQGPTQALASGGRVRGGYMPQTASPTGDNTGRADDISIRVSGGEYVIPKHVVEAKGTEFFDKMLESYNGGKKS